MIRVTKPTKAPAILRKPRSSGPKETKRLKTAYDAGERSFKFKDIYKAKSVKNALIKAQYGKCCFCESKGLHIDYGDVEHFRPKGGYRQNEADGLGKPGYYWLAYIWSNLFLSCKLCNQRFKRNLFPLANPDGRALSHHDEIDDEEPLFIDPAEDDPTEYIWFREEYPYAIDGNARGNMTIKALGLDRGNLEEARRDHLEPLKLLMRSAAALAAREDDVDDPLDADSEQRLAALRAYLKQAQEASAQYSAMARALLADSEW